MFEPSGRYLLRPLQVKYVLEELQGYAALRDPETGIEVQFSVCCTIQTDILCPRFKVGPAERVWKSDELISASLREKLLAAVAPLEAVPESEKDWHPGSGGLVFDLVHPSLYPIVYGRTIGKGPDSTAATVLTAPGFGGEDPKFTSEKFQWLPSDFTVDDDGKVILTSPYINNIHPTQHKDLHSVIPEILQRALPMFERVLSDVIRPLHPMRIATSGLVRGWGGEETADCIWGNFMPYPNLSSEEEYEEDPYKWYSKRKFNTPDARGKYDGDLEVMNDRLSLRGRTLEVIVKLANIHLTPEKPDYPGGKWHVEGLFHQFSIHGYH